MARCKDTSIRQNLHTILPPAKIRRLALQTGAVKRRRKIDIVRFVYALVLGFSTGSQRTIAGLRRAFERSAGTRIVPSAFYDRFTAPLVALLESLVESALERMDSGARRMRGACARFKEVVACDSTLLRLHNALEDLYPSVWTHYMKASAKLTVVMNVVGRGAKTVRISSGSTHDLHTLKCGSWLRGRLLIFDLGYFRSDLFREIGLNGGYYLSRLKKHNNPMVIASNLPFHSRAVGMYLSDVLDNLTADTLDLEVDLKYRLLRGPRMGYHFLRARVLGVTDSDTGELRLYVTNAPITHLQASHVAAIYSARWEVELLFRELKRNYRLGQTRSLNPHIVESLIYSALLTLLVARRLRLWLLAPYPHLDKRVTLDRWAILIESYSRDLLDLFCAPPLVRSHIEKRLEEVLLHEAIDPNRWRMHLVERAENGTLSEKRKIA